MNPRDMHGGFDEEFLLALRELFHVRAEEGREN